MSRFRIQKPREGLIFRWSRKCPHIDLFQFLVLFTCQSFNGYIIIGTIIMQSLSQTNFTSQNQYILNLMNLKLAESNYTQRESPLLKTIRKQAVINTPSTLATEKKFHSCQLHKPKNNPTKSHKCKMSLVRPKLQPHISHIKSIEEIRIASKEKDLKDERELKKERSKGIFVSISRKSSTSLEKN